MTGNPFDDLGLKREVVASLRRQGKLEEFLKGYHRLTQFHLHPDRGGEAGLAAAVNTAYSQLRKHPEDIDSWIAGMQNGANPEYLQIIDALAARVEEYQKMEAEFEKLKVAHAKALTGAGRHEKVRKAARSPRRGFVADFFTEDADTGMGSRTDAEPVVRAPPRVSTDPRTPPRAPAAEPAISREPIILSDIKLYDAKGKPVRTYKKVIFDGEAVKSSTGYLVKTQDDWITFCSRGKGKLVSLPLLYAVLERMTEEKHPSLPGIQKDLRENWLCTSTRINYARDTVTHNYGTSAAETYFCAMPAGNHGLNGVKDQKKWRTALQAQLMPKDIDKMVEVLGTVCDVPPYIWTADKGSRGSHPERAAFVDAYPGRLDLICYNYLGNVGRARRVAFE